MSTIQEISGELRAANFEHCRMVLESGDVMVLLAYLEGQGFISKEAAEAKEAVINVYEEPVKPQKAEKASKAKESK